MENQPTFRAIESFSERIEENDFFMQYTNHDLPDHYNSNFVLLKYNPSLPEFKMIESLHSDYQQAVAQNHLHFYWPENTGFYMDVMSYLSEENYELGKQKLLQIHPENFTYETRRSTVQFQIVTEELLPEFLKLNYAEDLEEGIAYAKHKESFYLYQFQQPHVKFLLASLDDHPVGSMIVISSTNHLEIDNVLTNKAYRKQGVATSMITHVVNEARQKHKTIILVADAEDTAKEMYKKMGFQTIATQIQAQKAL